MKQRCSFLLIDSEDVEWKWRFIFFIPPRERFKYPPCVTNLCLIAHKGKQKMTNTTNKQTSSAKKVSVKTESPTSSQEVKQMAQLTIKQRISQSKTWGEAQEIVDSLSGNQLIQFRDALQVVSDNFGLTMRDDFYLGLIESKIDAIAREKLSNFSLPEEK